MFKIALQLYSLKDQCGADLDAVLAKVKHAGYDGVETFSLHGLTAAELKAKLDAAGLACPSMHVGFDQFEKDLDKVIGDALTLGAEFITVPEIDKAERLVEFAKTKAAKISAAGLKWLYHNHDHEFKGNFFDVLLGGTQIGLQADTYWVERGGVKIKDFIEANSDRISCFHLKDEKEVGAGNIDFDTVLKAAGKLGHIWLIVEQEEFDKDPFVSIRECVENIRGIEKRCGL